MAELTATVSEIMEVVGGLNDSGKWLTLQHCLGLAEHDMYRNKKTSDKLLKKIRLAAEESEKNREEFLRNYHKDHVEGDLQLEGYILLGWRQGREKKEVCNTNWSKSEYGFVSELGMAAYLPKSGSRWVYIFNTHARYAAHPDPKWENKRWTYFAETDDKLCKIGSGCGYKKNHKRVSVKEISVLFSQTKPASYKERYPEYAWILSAPLWLLDEKKDMRPLFLAGGKPE